MAAQGAHDTEVGPGLVAKLRARRIDTFCRPDRAGIFDSDARGANYPSGSSSNLGKPDAGALRSNSPIKGSRYCQGPREARRSRRLLNASDQHSSGISDGSGDHIEHPMQTIN